MPVSNAARQAVIAMSREGDIHDMPAPTDYQPLFPGQVKPGHIKVELDFIPVEERLPEEEIRCFVLNGDEMYTAIYRGGIWFDAEYQTGILGGVTHWSEIPQASNAS